MTLPQSTTTTEPSLGQDVLDAARYYLGNRWVLLALGSVVVIAGLSFGGWGWLVAAGLAPVILSMLPCLVMCGLGVCVMCRSGKTQSTASLDAADSATSSSAPGVARMERPIAGGSSCCHEQAAEVPPPQVKQLQPTVERRDSLMRKLTKAVLPATILVAGIVAAPALYAQGDRGPSGSMMDHRMMGDNRTKDDGGLMGMMKMTGQMSQMMDHCNNMMSNSRPNDQWRKNAPSEPEKKG